MELTDQFGDVSTEGSINQVESGRRHRFVIDEYLNDVAASAFAGPQAITPFGEHGGAGETSHRDFPALRDLQITDCE